MPAGSAIAPGGGRWCGCCLPSRRGCCPGWRTVVIRRHAKPTIVRTERVWARADYKRWRAAGGQVPLPLLGEPAAAPVEQRAHLGRGRVMTARQDTGEVGETQAMVVELSEHVATLGANADRQASPT